MGASTQGNPESRGKRAVSMALGELDDKTLPEPGSKPIDPGNGHGVRDSTVSRASSVGDSVRSGSGRGGRPVIEGADSPLSEHGLHDLIHRMFGQRAAHLVEADVGGLEL